MKKLLYGLMAAMSPAMALAGETPLQVRYLSPDNAIIRISGADADMVLLPVQEGAPMAHIRVLNDGRLDKTLNVTLAENKIDYYVPLYLKDLKGNNVLLDVKCDISRSSMRDSHDAVWAKEIKLSDTFDTSNHEKFRPAYHHTPLYGWMNDPNGMFYKDGKWHLAYQWNPYGSKWENMTWGLSTSPDLIHWENLDAIIEPDALGTIFSGSAVVDKDNTAGFGEDAVVALYTSAGNSQMQSLAYSNDDGYTFKKYDGNPVIAYDRESRDPNMFWDEANKTWVLTLASALDHEMLIFNSPDLKEWTLVSKFGNGYGSQDGVWECPDLMQLPVLDDAGMPTGEKKWLLICNINPGAPAGGSGAQYFVGEFDGKTFKCDSAPEVTKWMDYGKDYYAAVSFSGAPADRHVVLGWMSNWQYANDVPTKQFRSANSLPRDLALFRAKDGEMYLASVPSAELEAMRGKAMDYRSSRLSKKGKTFRLPEANDGICEITCRIESADESPVTLTLANPEGEKVVMTVNPGADTFSMDRTASGLTDFSDNFPCVTVAPAYSVNKKVWNLRIFIDRSSVEAFSADGHFAMTNLVFPTSPYNTLTISSANGRGEVKNLKVYPIIL